EAFRLKEGLVGMAANKATHHLVATPKEQKEFRDRFEKARRGVLRDLETLRELVRADPERLNELNELARLEREWNEAARHDFQVFSQDRKGKQGFLEKGLAELRLQQGIQLQRDMAVRADRILGEERKNLETRRRQAEEATREGV